MQIKIKLESWGGIYEKEIFYDICDKLGIIIYHDMMFSCSTYPSTKEFLDEVRKELDYQIPRLQFHACIGLYAGNNEDFGAFGWYEETKNNRIVFIMDCDRLNNGLVGAKIKNLTQVDYFAQAYLVQDLMTMVIIGIQIIGVTCIIGVYGMKK